MIDFPKEIKKEVFYYLHNKDLFHLMLTCKEFNEIINTAEFWFNRLEADFHVTFSPRLRPNVKPKSEYVNFFKVYHLNNRQLSFANILGGSGCDDYKRNYGRYLKCGGHFE